MDRSFLTRAGWALAILLAGYLLVHGLRNPQPSPLPTTIPAATPLAREQPPPPSAVSAPTLSEMPRGTPFIGRCASCPSMSSAGGSGSSAPTMVSISTPGADRKP